MTRPATTSGTTSGTTAGSATADREHAPTAPVGPGELHERDEPDEQIAGRATGGIGAGAGFGWLLVVTGAVGLLAAATLLVEKILLLQDPTYVPSCSLNAVISCGSIMNTAQAEVFGFPNPIMGVAGFAVVLTVGAALLAGARFRRWFWWGLQLGVTFGIVFVHWLVVQSLYRINALCPYCMVVWVVTITLFVAVTAGNVRRGVLPGGRAAREVADFAPTIAVGWVLVVAALVVTRFWDYFSTLLPG
ncbi:vitamin K epoxide reductase family protein [Terracoccus luteus]|uniref:Putative membrane protein n=1 Tax=Terracoccus luteus TaxID=53356 RepID=A0A839PYM6_9MICO|nr:vitamin K epoxide reductase family protein [Terracoccus luteus]MBB2988243.1 putative membrane protein [Terracoccus luteus]MCP2173878.1 putative membrane protein [Terracoccus luteus]